MKPYEVKYTPRADRDLQKLPMETARQVIRKIHEIRSDPYRFVKKIRASDPRFPLYSVRVRRDVRAFISIHDDVLVIHVLEVEKRKTAYRDF